MSETIAMPMPPVSLQQNNQQTAENPSGATIVTEVVKPEETTEAAEATPETTNTPQPEQSISRS